MRRGEKKKIKVIYLLQGLQDNLYQIANVSLLNYYITTSLNF